MLIIRIGSKLYLEKEKWKMRRDLSINMFLRMHF